MVKLLAAVALQLIGLAAVATGLWMLAPWVSLVASGLLIVIIGLALERRLPTTEREATDARSTVTA